MKKLFMILGTCLMAALVVVSCNKPEDNKDNKENKENKENGNGNGNEEFSLDVSIDGNFTEWDALTEATADGEYYLYEENTDAERNGMLRLKLTSDEDYIYVYTEINYERIFVAEEGPFAQGGSWTGFLGTKHPGTPGALIIYLSGDEDASGAFAPVADSEGTPYWDYAGFDAFPQYYFCYDVAANKMQFGWNQNNWPQNHEDGWEKGGDKWGAPLSGHGAGWWGDDVAGTPVDDNTVSDENSFKFSPIVTVKDPVSKADVSVIKMEFSMDREAINENHNKVTGSVVVGAFYENVDQDAHQTNIDGSGKLPSGNKALTLKLK